MDIAIKIPTYNSEKTILETLKSIINQTCVNFRVYIFDNCSTDNTIKIIESLHDIRIKIITSENNYGWVWNFNRCLAATGEEMMLFAHSDDIYHPKFLEINLELSRLKKNSLIFSKGVYFKNNVSSHRFSKNEDTLFQIDEYLSHEDLLKNVIIRGNFMFCPTAFGKSEIFSTVIGEFNGKDFKGSCDLDAWLRASKYHPIIIIKNPIIFFHRLSNNQLSFWDRKEDDSYFVRCINSYVQEISSFHDKKKLSNYIRWHEIFHSVFINLEKKYCSKLLYVNLIFETLQLDVIFKKKYKLLALLFIALLFRLFPYKYRIDLNLFLLRITR
jgi:glycosyltransferase involved in cell wall biosynthesis